MLPALTRIARGIDKLSRVTGHTVAWATLIMVLTTVLVVVLRHVFQIGWIWLQEVSVYLHALVFLLGAAYTLSDDEHVRVDVFYRGFSTTGRNWVNRVGVVLFLLPTMAFIFWSSWFYVVRSWTGKESSHETGGLIYPFPSLLKTSILIACLLLALQGLSLFIRTWSSSSDDQANEHHHLEI